MKTLLFVCYGGSHVEILLLVATKLKSYGYNIKFLALTTSLDIIKKSGFEYYTYKDFFSSSECLEYGRKLCKTLPVNKLNIEESIAYLGQNYLELVNNYGVEKAENLYNTKGRSSFYPLNSLIFILKQLRPSLVVATSSPRSEQASIDAANKLGIPSIAIGDLFMLRPLEWFKNNDFANKVCVFNKESFKLLVNEGRKKESISITGNPSFDELSNIKVEINNNRKKYKVLWASQPEPNFLAETNKIGDPKLPIKIEERLIEIFTKKKDLELYVRNHPNEEKRIYPGFVKLSNDDVLEELLLEMDLVITLTSIVGFKAALLGKELITIDLSVLSEVLPYSAYGYSKSVKDLNSLENEIDYCFENRLYRKNKKYKIENATENICSEIIKLLNKE